MNRTEKDYHLRLVRKAVALLGNVTVAALLGKSRQLVWAWASGVRFPGRRSRELIERIFTPQTSSQEKYNEGDNSRNIRND
jgi:hypothetical protein